MNTAKLVNSALTGGGLIYPENLNVVIGSENKGYPKGTVLDANATLSLAGQAQSGSTQQGDNQQNDPFLKNVYTYNTNLKRGFQMSYDDNNKYSDNLIIGDIEKGKFNGNSVGYGNIIQGNKIISVGGENILTGSYIVSFSHRNHITSYNIPYIAEYTKVDDNNIIVTAKKNSKLYNVIKNSKILFYNVEIKDKNNIIINDKDSGGVPILQYTTTDVNDTQIKLTSSDFKNFIKTQTGKLMFFNIYNNGKTNVINGSSIVNNGTSSIMSGSNINVSKVFDSAAFGTGIDICNNSEIGVGAYNVSKALTGDDGYVFTVGAGSEDKRKNAIEVRRDGRIYIYNVGGFDGINSSEAKTIQSVIQSTVVKFGSTADRPTDSGVGFCYFDTTLNKPIWCKIPMQGGTAARWVDASGNEV